MKLVTKIAIIATITTFMFAGVNISWGNTYSGTTDLSSAESYGVHFDINDNTTIGWENGLMVGLAGPAGSTFRLGMGSESNTTGEEGVGEGVVTTTAAVPTLGMSYTWWEGAGTGWATNLSTAIDFQMVDGHDAVAGTKAGDFSVTINLGLGF